ncbi:MAG TPA: bifunctional riboflavin kinase/FAD synthetase [Acidimicrobiia bacterium]|nr:bifunctional riboflavin kinase/FAD synthetase [Acidimicrobiia bacterium]
MRIFRGAPSTWSPDRAGRALAIGVFDGVHLGHRHVLDVLRDRASGEGMEPGVLTFDPHPLAVVAPDRAPAMLTGIEHRLELLGGLGVELAAVLDFGEPVRGWSPATFVTEVISRALGAKVVVVGEDFRFGKDRTGHVGLLREMGSALGFETEVVPLVGEDRPISSTRIRELIAVGDVTGAAVALTRPHELWGEVVAGAGRGRSIGIPTANLAVPPGMAMPAPGVYAVTAGLDADEALPAVANIGTRPTFEGRGTTVEVHLLDFDDDLYGETLRARFIARLRDERRFDGPDDLVEQINRDIEGARELLGRGHDSG